MKGIIRVALFEDLFWNNNSEVYPCNPPHPSLYTEIPDVQPKFITPYTAICILDGEYNAAIFNGVYYQLKKMEMHDIGISPGHSVRYKYQLEYDVMMNFLINGGRVKGTVIRTNNEEWLSRPGVLQTCKPILEEPCKLVYGNFEETEDNWKKTAELLLPTKRFVHRVPTKKSFENFLEHITKAEIVKRSSSSEFAAFEDDVIIAGFLEDSEQESWKNNVIELIKEQYSNLENLQLVKVTQLAGSPLTNKMAISHKSHSIGVAEESFQGITKIDLSTIEDIVPISTLDLTKAKPTHDPSKKDLKDVHIKHFITPVNYVRKIARTPYLPLSNKRDDIEEAAYLPIEKGLGTWQLYNTDYTGYKDNRPQKIKFKQGAGTSSDTGYLWWVDILDFCLAGSLNQPEPSFSWKRSMPDIKGNYYYQNEYVFNKLSRKRLPPIGFLMFDVDRKPSQWKKHTYIGETPLTKIRYRSGISWNLVNNYKNTDKWWNRLSPAGKVIRGAEELSFLSYDTDLFLWLYFAPMDNRYQYGYQYNDYWGFNKVISSSSHYIPQIVARDIVVGGQTQQVNPFTEDRIDNWIVDRQRKIDDVSIYTEIDLPYPINKGDILISSLTHKITDNNFSVSDGVYSSTGARVGIIVGTTTTVGTAGAVLTLVGSTIPGVNLIMLFASTATILFASTLQTAKLELEEKLASLNNIHIKDMFHTNTVPFEELADKTIFFIQDGKLFVGSFHKFTRELELDDGESQIVESVEDQTKKIVDFYHIRKLGGEIQKLDPKAGLTNLQQEILLNHVLSFAYDGDGQKIHNYTMDRLKGNDLVQLFDLVNTDWYAYVQGGRVHLISKSNQDFYVTKPYYNKLTIPHSGDIPIYDKINQKASISIYGNVKPLNTKFNLRDDKFVIRVTPYIFNEEASITEYFHIISENQFDYLNEMVESPKITTKATAELSATQVELVKLQMRQQTQNYYLQKEMNDLNFREKMKRFQWDREDLHRQLVNNILGAVGTGLEMGSLIGIPGAIGGSNLISLFKPLIPEKANSAMAAYAVTKQTLMTGKYGRGVSSTLGRFISSIPFFTNYTSLKSRIDENEQMYIEKNAMEMIGRDMKETHNYQRMVQQVNQLSSAFVKRDVNERSVLEKMKKDGIGLIHLELFLPTPLQSEHLREIFEIYGTECFIPDCEMVIGKETQPTIVQFSQLTADSISSNLAADLNIRESIKVLFESGIRFIYHNHVSIQPNITTIYAKSTKEFVRFNELDITKLTGEEWHRISVAIPRDDIKKRLLSTDKYGLTDEEYQKHKDSIDPLDPVDDVTKIIEGRGSGINIVIKPNYQPNQYIQELEEQLRWCRIDYKNISQAKNTCDLINARRIKELEGKLKAGYSVLEGAKRLVEAERDELKEKLAKCGEDIESHKSANEDVKQELSQTKQELDNCKQDYQNEKQAKEAAQKAKEEVEKQKQVIIGEKERLEKEKEKVIKEKEEAIKQKDGIEKQWKEEVKTMKEENTSLLNNIVNAFKNDYHGIKHPTVLDRSYLEVLIQEAKDSGREFDDYGSFAESALRGIIEEAWPNVETKPPSDNRSARQLWHEMDNFYAGKETSWSFPFFHEFTNDDGITFTGEWEKIEEIIAETHLAHFRYGIKAVLQKRELKDKFEEEKKVLTTKFNEEKTKLTTKLEEADKKCQDEVKKTREQMEETHNEKLREFLTQRDQAVAQARQAGFNSRNEEVLLLQQELASVKEKLEKTPSERSKEYCELLKKYINESYEVNFEEREDGSNNLRDLVLEIIQEVNWMRKARLDTSLGSKYSQLRPVLTELMKLQSIPLVAKWEDVVDHHSYPEYRKFLATGGTHNGGVDEVIKKVNEIKIMDLENITAAHGLKSTLDELNWLVWKAKNDLKEPLKNDRDLQYFFKHIYPGASLEKYRVLFGDPNIAVIKKRFFNEKQCFDGEEETPLSHLQSLANIERTTTLSVDEIDKQDNRREQWDNFVPNFNGIPLSSNIEDITVFMAPKFINSNRNQNFLSELSIYKNKYSWWDKFPSKYFSWMNLKGKYTGIEWLNPQRKETVLNKGFYLYIDKKDAWTSVMSNRNYLWQNRGRLAVPADAFTDAIRNFYWVWVDSDGSTSGRTTKINLLNVFGPKLIKDVKILLGILGTNLLFVKDNPKDTSNNRWWNVSVRLTNIMAAHRNLEELTKSIWPLQKTLLVVIEFADPLSFLNYVYRHVKLNLPRLEDPFAHNYSDTSKINFRELISNVFSGNN